MLIRLAGMIAAMATCAAAATEARAQDPEGGVIVIDQVQLGDVFASQTLNVEDASDQITLSQSAQGNTASGTVEDGGSLDLTSSPTMSGDAMAEASGVDIEDDGGKGNSRRVRDGNPPVETQRLGSRSPQAVPNPGDSVNRACPGLAEARNLAP